MARTKHIARKSSTHPDTPQEKRRSFATKRDNKRAKASNGKTQKEPAKRNDVAIKDIRRYQRTGELLIPRMPFRRVIRSVMQKEALARGQVEQYRIQSLACEALQEAAEMYLVNLFDDAYMAAIHARRVTVMPKDLDLVRRIRKEF